LYSLSNDYNNLTRRLTYTSLTDYLIAEVDGMTLPKYRKALRTSEGLLIVSIT